MNSVTVRPVDTRDDPAIPAICGFFRDYAAWMGVNLSFQSFDEEIAALPGHYVLPSGRLFVGELNGQFAGCVGLLTLSDGVCEMKRMYVAPERQRQGVGSALAMRAIRAAQEMGFTRLVLDAAPSMRMAVKLYREMGFTQAPAYHPAPLEGAVSLSLDLRDWSEEKVRKENLSHLFDFNRAWSKQVRTLDPDYFNKLSNLQNPDYLWIGCSDSRVPANQIVGLLPGEVFVHRNVANIVAHTDLNCLSVIQYAVDVLRVKHIMVVGHYGCGGVCAALRGERIGLAEIWLRHVRDVRQKHESMLSALPEERRLDRLCELNTLEQAVNVCQTYVAQDAWQRGQALTVHAWIYSLRDGVAHDLVMTVDHPDDLESRYQTALFALDDARERRQS
ncbi:MAG: carbonate dehydratase [Zoogloeaceae bacterium]|jgi:carbonic anhydrase|nr:carbonate dehydratase [Zoogloeaceae bacterium]